MTTPAELQDRVRSAAAAQSPLCIIGGNSKKQLGREVTGDPVDVSGWSGVVDYQPSELVITVRSGTTISELQQVLAAEEQVLASEPPEFDGKATVGGTLACNLSGPPRPWLGSIRDHVLGVRIVNGKGELLRFGGQVMKNVAGYDVSRLMAGAMGTLGIMTEVTFRVMPKPETAVTVRRAIDADESLRAMNEISGSPLPLTGACWCDGSLNVRLAGPASVVGSAADRIGGEVLGDDAGFWSALRETTLPFFDGAEDLWCISLRSTRSHFMRDESWLFDWRGARRWLAASCDRGALQRRVAEAGGEAWQVRGAGQGAEVFPERSQAYRRMLLGLKRALDPDGIFNPGRLYAWL